MSDAADALMRSRLGGALIRRAAMRVRCTDAGPGAKKRSRYSMERPAHAIYEAMSAFLPSGRAGYTVARSRRPPPALRSSRPSRLALI